jgi:hypothetical protein
VLAAIFFGYASREFMLHLGFWFCPEGDLPTSRRALPAAPQLTL